MKPVTETLKSLIASHGEDIIQQPQRLKAILADLLPYEKRMRYLLEVSLRAEIPAKLKDIQQAETEVRETKANALKHYFKEEYFLEDNAVKSVFDCWVEVIKSTLTKPVIYSEPVTDIDGNVYKTVQIGNQIWMTENLRVSRYRNGDLIPNVQNNEEWSNLKTGAWCNYENNSDFDSEYGKLYNWFTVVDKRGLAPKGWHLPSYYELQQLIDYLGDENVAGRKLKETGSSHRKEPNKGKTIESGFRAPPGSYRYFNGTFYDTGYEGFWWSATEDNTTDASVKSNYHTSDDGLFSRLYNTKSNGLSVRCLRD